MNSLTKEVAISSFQKRVEGLVPSIELCLNKPDINQSLWEMLLCVDTFINNAIDHNEPANTRFVFGGRSAQLTKILLEAIQQISCDQEIATPIKEAVVLSTKENKELYEGTTFDTDANDFSRDYKIPASIATLNSGSNIFFLDDRSRTGEKAHHIFRAMSAHGYNNVYFVAFTAGIETLKNIDQGRWTMPEGKYFVGSYNTDIFQYIDGISYLISRYLLLRSNKQVQFDGKVFDTNRQEVGLHTIQNLRKHYPLLRNLRERLMPT